MLGEKRQILHLYVEFKKVQLIEAEWVEEMIVIRCGGVVKEKIGSYQSNRTKFQKGEISFEIYCTAG